ncbi:MAG: sigma-70 family RNA polymerase sigma factor [Proteobacteria bacterium]|nr:sigma-70 family RNA polymerase sigma factor [Pseudomonadota bacterium]
MSGEELATLVARHLRGDRNATSLLLGRLEPTMLRLASALLRDRIEAEDVVVDVMIDLVPRLSEIDPEALQSYVRRSTRHACIDLMRRRDRRDSRRALRGTASLRVLDGGEGTPIEAIPSHETLPDDKVIGVEEDRIAVAAIADLPAPIREAVRLYYGMGFTYEEVAEQLDKSRAWVGRALLQARDAVGAKLRQAEDEVSHGA